MKGVSPMLCANWTVCFLSPYYFEFGRINSVTMYLSIRFIKFIHNVYPASAGFDHETWRSCMECHYSLLILRAF